MELEFNQFVRSPFSVEAIQITDENIAQVAKLIGKLEITEDGVIYIAIDKKKVPVINKAFVGYYVTRFGRSFRVYNEDTFLDEFVEWEPNITFNFETRNAEDLDDEVEAAASEIADQILETTPAG